MSQDGGLQAVVDDTAAYYQRQLHSDAADAAAAAAARAFLRTRAVPTLAVVSYGLGYAPPRWTGLTEHLRACGHRDEALLATGVSLQGRRGLLDRFRGRLIFPVHHPTSGQVVAFLGRLLPAAGVVPGAEEAPKYLNSPESSSYHKGEVLYGLSAAARQALAAGAVPVLVEGPLDAIAVTSSSTTTAYVGVAPCGTAVTARQIDVLQQACAGPLSERLVVTAFDHDAAGQRAGLHTFALLRTAGAWPHMAALPSGLDPADLAVREGPSALAAALLEARPLADAVVDGCLEPWTGQLRWAEGRVGATRAAARLITTFPADQVGRQVHRVAQHLGVEHGQVTTALLEAISSGDPPPATSAVRPETSAGPATRLPPDQAARTAGASYPTDIRPTDLRRASARPMRASGDPPTAATSSTDPRRAPPRPTATAERPAGH
jgi:DNA primase